MTPVFGKNMAMKEMLRISQEDHEHQNIIKKLFHIRRRISHFNLKENQLKSIRSVANEMIHDIQKELMSAQPTADSRLPSVSPRSTTKGTSDSAD